MAAPSTTKKLVPDRAVSLAATKPLINFLRGWPAPALLEESARYILNGAKHVLSSPEEYVPALQYAADEGPLPLRESLAAFLTSFFSPSRPISIERITTTGGASQSFAVILSTFTDPVYTRAAFVVEPTYYLACRMLDDAGLKIRGLPDGSDGADVAELRKQIEEVENIAQRERNDRPIYKPLPRAWPTKIYKYVIYAVPSFSNPTGRNMTLSCREALVRLAREYDALIVTDDVYDFLWWDAESSDCKPGVMKATLPRIVDVDRYLEGGAEREGADGFGNALSNGSFSKICGPGVRTGWVEGTPKLAYAVSQAGSSRSGGAPSNATGTFLAHALSTGALQKNIQERLIPAYSRRHRIILEAIRDHLEPLGVQVLYKSTTLDEPVDGIREAAGGYFVYLRLPDGLSADIVAERVQDDENVIVTPERICRVPVKPGTSRIGKDSHIRLCFAWEDEDALTDGIVRLSRTIRGLLDGTSSHVQQRAPENISRFG